MAVECVVCGRRGYGVRKWNITMPGGTPVEIELCSRHSAPLRRLVTKTTRQRRQVGVAGLDELVDVDPP